MRVENRALLAQHANDFNRVALLPEKMAQIAVGADLLADGLAQLQQRFRVVHHKIGMHFQSNLVDSVFARELGRLLPVRNYFFLPLPVEHLAVLRRPAVGDPVGHGVGGTAAGTTGKAHDHAYSQTLGQQHRVPE